MTTSSKIELKKLISPDDVIEKIDPILHYKVHKVNDPFVLKVGRDGYDFIVNTGKKEFRLNTDDSKIAVSRFIGVRQDAFDRMNEKLQRRLVSSVLRHSEPFAIISNNGEVESFRKLNSMMASVNIPEMINHISKELPDSRFSNANIRRGKIVDIGIVTGMSEIVAPGDAIQAGALISVSPTGVISPRAQSYTVRQICSNGAISASYGNAYEYKDPEYVNQWAVNSIKESFDSVGLTAEQYRRLSNIKFESDKQLYQVAKNLIVRSRMSPDNASAVYERIQSSKPTTMWDLFNIITFVSTHNMESASSSMRAMRVASDFAAVHSGANHECDSCGKVHKMGD